MTAPAARAADPVACVDVRDVACPMTWVRTRVALDRLAPGEALEVLLAAGEPLENVPRTAEEEGHRVAARAPWPAAGAGAWRVVLVKGAPALRNDLLP
ncbi:MAG: sulfurtransferase TusA family protein [Anaeromyxobacteraceae bacterium]